jgi:hypothetical protein
MRTAVPRLAIESRFNYNDNISNLFYQNINPVAGVKKGRLYHENRQTSNCMRTPLRKITSTGQIEQRFRSN